MSKTRSLHHRAYSLGREERQVQIIRICCEITEDMYRGGIIIQGQGVNVVLPIILKMLGPFSGERKSRRLPF